MGISYNVIGLMSGTSMDGLDIIFCTLSKPKNEWEYKIHYAKTVSYSQEWLDRLNTARDLSESELYQLSAKYGVYLGKCVNDFISENALSHIDYISSHGHTIHHQPSEGITVQIGDGEMLSKETNLPVVFDFRTQDVEYGGQGAPLVPIGDKFLFGSFQACLNLGGFANISFDYGGERVAFDISPANIVMNYLVKKIGFEYDEGGALASKGNVIPKLFEELNALEYYQESIPKSLGIEWVEKMVHPLLSDSYAINDMLFTYTQHVCYVISEEFRKYELTHVLVSGGGVYNSYFMDVLKKSTKAKITVPTDEVIEFKEALIFAFLGVLRIENEMNVLKSVTGANQDHSSGKIVFPK